MKTMLKRQLQDHIKQKVWEPLSDRKKIKYINEHIILNHIIYSIDLDYFPYETWYKGYFRICVPIIDISGIETENLYQDDKNYYISSNILFDPTYADLHEEVDIIIDKLKLCKKLKLYKKDRKLTYQSPTQLNDDNGTIKFIDLNLRPVYRNVYSLK